MFPMERIERMERCEGRFFAPSAPADVLVVGAGHAGCEAAFAAARLGCETVLVTSQRDTLGLMPCNPAVGGLAKSHLVVELDALGGEMGLNADLTGLQYRTLNASRGPAVRAVRVQCDKAAYSARMARVAASLPKLTLLEGTVTDLILSPPPRNGEKSPETTGKLPSPPSPFVDTGEMVGALGCADAEAEGKNPLAEGKNGRQSGVRVMGDGVPFWEACGGVRRPPSEEGSGVPVGVLLADGRRLYARQIVMTAGTALGGKIWVGHEGRDGGGDGRPAVPLPNTLRRLSPALGWRRLKTGTPPRVWNASVDWGAMTRQEGEISPVPFFSRRMRLFQASHPVAEGGGHAACAPAPVCFHAPRRDASFAFGVGKNTAFEGEPADFCRASVGGSRGASPDFSSVPKQSGQTSGGVFCGSDAFPSEECLGGGNVPRGTRMAQAGEPGGSVGGRGVPPSAIRHGLASVGSPGKAPLGSRALSPLDVPRGTSEGNPDMRVSAELPTERQNGFFGDSSGKVTRLSFGPEGVPVNAPEWGAFGGFATYRLGAFGLAGSPADGEASPLPGGEPTEREMSAALSRARVAQLPCFQTHTTPEGHAIVRGALGESALYGGEIVGEGVRYCPSIEDKIVRFGDRGGHHVILEPEGVGCPWCYPNGLSNSLPWEAQLRLARSVPGLARATFAAPGYAIEYDCVDPRALDARLAVKGVPNLFLAGQINGTTGYEEAAAQGFLAGVNAALAAQGREPFLLSRDEAYIGVMVDDLITKGADEPYRMFTSRAERRLLLRPGNAHLRLHAHAKRLGIVSGALLRLTEREAAWLSGTEAAWRVDWLDGRGLSRWRLLAREGVGYARAATAGKRFSEEKGRENDSSPAEPAWCGLTRRFSSHDAFPGASEKQSGALALASGENRVGSLASLSPSAPGKAGNLPHDKGGCAPGEAGRRNPDGNADASIGIGESVFDDGADALGPFSGGEAVAKDGKGEVADHSHEKVFFGGEVAEDGEGAQAAGFALPPEGTVGGEVPEDWAEELTLRAKYEGYIAHEAAQAARLAREGAEPIPSDFDYASVKGLRFEALEKLRKVRPDTLRRASGIPGVNPADVALLSLALRRRRRSAVE